MAKVWIAVLGFFFTLNCEAMRGDDWLSDDLLFASEMSQSGHCSRCDPDLNKWLPSLINDRIKNNIDLNAPIECFCYDGKDKARVPLLLSATSDNFLKITKKLLRHNADLNCTITGDHYHERDRYPLLHAVTGELKTVKTLLRAGIKFTTCDSRTRDTVLHWICKDLVERVLMPEHLYSQYVAKQIKIVKLLLHAGANPNMPDKNGRIALFGIYCWGDVNRTPYNIVKDCVQPIITQFLLYGSDITLKDCDGLDLIAFAEKKGQTRGAQFLKDWRDGKIKLKKKKIK